MLIFSAQSLAYIAVPKTGTTAIEAALRPWADIIFAKRRKHMTAQRFHRRVAPFLAETFNLRPECVAMLRDPEEQLRSWYRYRTGERQKGSDRSTLELSFDQFVMDVISDDPPPHAAIGSQLGMLASSEGEVLVHHLFAYENQPKFRGFLADRFGEEIKPTIRNVSPEVDAPLSPDVGRALRKARSKEFDLYQRVIDADGHLIKSIG